MTRKIPDEFVPLSISYRRDPSIRRVGPMAELLFIRALTVVRVHKTDGVLAEFDIAEAGEGLRKPRELAAALVREGLWVEVDGGWLVRSWEKWNGTKAQVNAEKEAQKAAAIKTNHDRWHVDSGKTDPRCPHCSAASVATSLAIASESQKEKETKKETKTKSEKEKESVATDTDSDRSAGGADAPAQTLIAEWIEHCTERPPSRVVGQVAREIQLMLAEGQPYEDVRRGLAAWARKGLHPSTLASVVHETRTVPTRGATTNDRVAQALDLAARLAEREQQQATAQIGAAS